MFRHGLIGVFAVASMLGCEARDRAGQRALDQLAELQKKKAAEAAAKREDKLAPLAPVDGPRLEAPYGDEGSQRVTPDGECPEGLWALFAGAAPGANADEKRANEANRKALADGLRAKQFIVKMRVGSGVVLNPYDAAEQHWRRRHLNRRVRANYRHEPGRRTHDRLGPDRRDRPSSL